MGYTIQVIFCVFSLLGTTLMGDFQSKKLMFRAWFPFDITASWFAFCMTFLYQFVGLVIVSNGVCIFDTLFAGLLLHICCQLEMLVYRLHNIEGNEIQSLKHCVWHHNKIFRFVSYVFPFKQINDLTKLIEGYERNRNELYFYWLFILRLKRTIST